MMNIRSLRLLFTIGLYLAVDLCANPSEGKILQGDAKFNISENLLTIEAQDKTTVEWSSFSNDPEESIYISLPSSSDVFYIHASEASKILGKITSNGSIVFLSPKGITVGNKGKIECPQIHLEGDDIHFAGSIQAPALTELGDKGGQVTITGNNIQLASSSWIDASGKSGGGKICIGGGWQGKNSAIHNAQVTKVEAGSTLLASALCSGNGGTIVLWSEKSTTFAGAIIARGAGEQGAGGAVEVSSKGYLDANEGRLDVRAENGPSGRILLDPATITINAASPDICGNATGMDMTSATQLDNATTTPTCAPTPSTANSIITAAALESFLTTGANITLAAGTSITVNAAVSSAANNVTLTLTAPLVDLNNNISLTGTGSLLQGSGVATVNVISPGLTFIIPGIIQDAVFIVETGGTVNLLSTTYAPQQVNITKNLTLSGLGNTYMGATGTTITCPSSAGTPPPDMPYSFTFNDTFGHNYPYHPVILVQSPATDVIIQNLTVDGNNEGTPGYPPNTDIAGIAFYDASGTIQDVYVKQVRAMPAGGDQNTNSIFIATDIGNTSINIQNSYIDTFQKRGIYVTAVANTATPATINMNVIKNNTITGTPASMSPSAAPNGIECLCTNTTTSTITGIVENNIVSNCSDLIDGASGGLLFVNLANLELTTNTTINCDTGMLVEGCLDVTLNNYTFQCNKGSAVDFVLNAPGGVITVQNSTFLCNVYQDLPDTAAVYIYDINQVTYQFINNTFTESIFAIDVEGAGASSGPTLIMNNNSFNPIIPGTTCVGTCP
jgi:hypothetical protein